MDLDGRDDVVTLHGGWNRAGVYAAARRGRIRGRGPYAIPYASHYSPHGLALGDVSGNGSPDLVLADYNHGLVVLYGNAASPPPPPPPPPPRADVGVDVTASSTRVRPKKGFWFDVKVTNAGPDATATSLTVQLTGGPSGSPRTARPARCSRRWSRARSRASLRARRRPADQRDGAQQGHGRGLRDGRRRRGRPEQRERPGFGVARRR